MSVKPLIIERTFDAPVSMVWGAISDSAQMKQWYFDIPDFKLQKGHEFAFNADCDGRIYLHLCRITEVVPEQRLSYSWKYENHPGESHVIFELVPSGEKTMLRLTHEGLETFGTTNPDFERGSFEEGWAEFMDKGLAYYLTNKNAIA